MVSFCALMRAGVAVPPFFAGVEKDEGETWSEETKNFKSSFSSAAQLQEDEGDVTER